MAQFAPIAEKDDPRSMNFCGACGAAVEQKVPPGDNRLRHVCSSCDKIHYQNPKVVAGCIPVWEDKVLLCKRAIDPRCGYWTLPAGFMEMDETLRQAAARETMEEANARVEILNLFAVFSLPHVNQVYMMFNARMLAPDCFAGDESQEVRLYSEADIPWEQLAFPTIRHSLKFFFEDRENQAQRLHTGDIIRNDTGHELLMGPETPC